MIKLSFNLTNINEGQLAAMILPYAHEQGFVSSRIALYNTTGTGVEGWVRVYSSGGSALLYARVDYRQDGRYLPMAEVRKRAREFADTISLPYAGGAVTHLVYTAVNNKGKEEVREEMLRYTSSGECQMYKAYKTQGSDKCPFTGDRDITYCEFMDETETRSPYDLEGWPRIHLTSKVADSMGISLRMGAPVSHRLLPDVVRHIGMHMLNNTLTCK